MRIGISKKLICVLLTLSFVFINPIKPKQNQAKAFELVSGLIALTAVFGIAAIYYASVPPEQRPKIEDIQKGMDALQDFSADIANSSYHKSLELLLPSLTYENIVSAYELVEQSGSNLHIHFLSLLYSICTLIENDQINASEDMLEEIRFTLAHLFFTRILANISFTQQDFEDFLRAPTSVVAIYLAQIEAFGEVLNCKDPNVNTKKHSKRLLFDVDKTIFKIYQRFLQYKTGVSIPVSALQYIIFQYDFHETYFRMRNNLWRTIKKFLGICPDDDNDEFLQFAY